MDSSHTRPRQLVLLLLLLLLMKLLLVALLVTIHQNPLPVHAEARWTPHLTAGAAGRCCSSRGFRSSMQLHWVWARSQAVSRPFAGSSSNRTSRSS
jgi:hypothetical protein